MRMQRGRALRFLVLLMALWIGARIYWLWKPDTAPIAATGLTAGEAKAAVPDMADAGGPATWFRRPSALVLKSATYARGIWLSPITIERSKGIEVTKAGSVQNTPSPLPLPTSLRHSAKGAPPSLPVITPQVPRRAHPWSLYAFAFLRPGAGSAELAQTRYGGSQLGAIAGYRIGGSRARPLEAIARIGYAPDDPQSLEAGAGLRWTPRRGLSVAAEYRRRADGTGTAIAYAAGGVQTALPVDFTLEAYGQAGVYTQDGASASKGVHPFADAQVTAVRPLASMGGAVISAGAGSWAGGTDEIQRLDIGPRLSASVPLGDTRVTIAADYRVRVAGNAEPANGPTLTVAAGF